MTFRCLRWDKAMRICIGGDPNEKDGGRWKGDPIALNDEAFFLSRENQCKALDFMEEAPAEIRAMMLPIWKYCFAQWLVFDAGCEAAKRGILIAEILSTKQMIEDIESLQSFCDSGGLDKSKKSEKWTWKILENLPPAASPEWGNDDASPMVQAAREERGEGVDAWNIERYDKAYWHFQQGIRMLARLPEPLTVVQSKLGCDIFKNIAATALKLNMNRVALNAAAAAINLFPDDQKAWFRKACALQNLDRDSEATQAFSYAGYVEAEKELGPLVQPPPEGAGIDDAMQVAIEKLVFLECGIDSLDAIDMIALIQVALQERFPNLTVPQILVFNCPTVGEAASFILAQVDGQRRFIVEVIWRAMCTVLKCDPVEVKFSGRTMSEEKALGALLTLLENYESPEYVTKAKELARLNKYECRPFLVQLRRHALERQIQPLEIRGFPCTYEGMRKLECAIVGCSNRSKQVKELLYIVRQAAYGGPDCMWKRVFDV